LQALGDAIRSTLQEAFSPIENGLAVDAQPPGTFVDGDLFVGPQNDPRPVGDPSFRVA
jgi:hypothetical protein